MCVPEMGINTSGFLIEQTDESADWKCQVPKQDLKCLEVCLGSHPKDQHPPALTAEERSSDCQFAPVHNIIAV